MQWTEIPRDQIVIPGETMAHGATPYFRYESIFNEPQSMIQGKPVHDLKEVVEIRFAANPQYRPIFGVDEMWRMVDNRIVTWAERYADQYRAFLDGATQESEGTPLEELIPYGISQAQLSLCRALSIYSVEALYHLEGAGLKRLGQHGNDLKPMAKRYIDAKADGSHAQSQINELQRQLAELRAQSDPVADPFLSTQLQEQEPSPPTGFEEMSDAQLKDEIEKIAGARPKGNPSRTTLETMLEQALAA